MGLTYATSIITEFLESFLFTNIFFFTDIKLLIFNTILWKFQKFWASATWLKPASKLPTLLIFAYFIVIFTIGKNENIYFFFKPVTSIKHFVHR